MPLAVADFTPWDMCEAVTDVSVYGAINPYDELTAAQLIEVRDGKIYLRYSKEDVNIEITTPLVIKADQIVPNDTGMGWQPHDPTNPDDDIIIEI